MKMEDISQNSISMHRIRYLELSPFSLLCCYFHFGADLKSFLLQNDAANRNPFPLVAVVVDAASAFHEADNGPYG